MKNRILIVDDYEDIHEIIPMIFSDENYIFSSALTASNLEAEISRFDPHLIIMDVLIGDYDGRKLCSELKSNPKYKDIKIILTSASIMNFMQHLCHPDDFIEKPFEIADMKAKVNQLLLSE